MTIRFWYTKQMGSEGWAVWEDRGSYPHLAHMIASNLSKEDALLIAYTPELRDVLKRIVEHAQEMYPHFESARGQAEIDEALLTIKMSGG